MLLTAWSAVERREERVARSIWRFVCWCIRLEKVRCCRVGEGDVRDEKWGVGG